MGFRRIVLFAALVLGLGTAPALAAAPVASADALDCIDYLYWKHFDGLIISHACVLGEEGNVQACESTLTWMNVTPPAVVEEACELATRP
ncbi:hypothetical protein ACFYOT_18620 [Saccharothrix saharensis]|uniref:hypothetical protein n=1 Tax=Saccharothrix saharensis TaxID=571190 RepID=UPI0036BB921F